MAFSETWSSKFGFGFNSQRTQRVNTQQGAIFQQSGTLNREHRQWEPTVVRLLQVRGYLYDLELIFFPVYLYFNFIHLSFLEWNLFPHHFLTNSMLFCLFLIIMLSYLGDTICCLRCMIACSVISFLWFENFIYNYGNLSWFILVSSTIGFSKVRAHIDAKNQLVLWSLTFFVYTFTLHPNLLS